MEFPRKQSPEQWAQDLDFAKLERDHGLPSGLLTNLVRQESRGNCDAGSPAGAQGLCQFMPPTAKQYGVDVKDPESSAKGAARYLEDLMDRFDGDVTKAVAAYNAGPGRVSGAIKKYGSDWLEGLRQEQTAKKGKSETFYYVQVVTRGIGETFLQREAHNGNSEQDREFESRRRVRQLEEENALPDFVKKHGMGGLLGMIFFAFIAKILSERVDKLPGQESVLGADRVETPPAAERTPIVSGQRVDVASSASTLVPVNQVKLPSDLQLADTLRGQAEEATQPTAPARTPSKAVVAAVGQRQPA